MRNLLRPGSRHLILTLLFFLPERRRIAIERWLRGREEYLNTRDADCILMSWGKSGRTWLRVMISRFYQQRFGLPGDTMLGFDNYKKLNPAIPSIYFTHGNYLRNYTGDWDTRTDFYPKRVVMLVRDPRDVAVSQYFQWKHRMLSIKKRLNRYPADENISLFDFVMDRHVGLPMIIDFFNIWAREIVKTRDSLVIRYEDMRERPGEILAQVLEFLGTPGTEQELSDAVEFAAYENMKKLETKKSFRGTRLVPGDQGNPDSFKVRRAKVGGFRDYFDEPQIEQIEELVRSRMLPDFGYGGENTESHTVSVRI